MKSVNRFLVFMVLFASCTKYLEPKPASSLVIPKEVANLQALLDNNLQMNLSSYMGEASADNYYMTTAVWSALSTEAYKNIYIWGPELIYDTYANDWSDLYQQAYYANVVLEYGKKIDVPQSDKAALNKALGSAYFFRARAFHNVAIHWAKAFDPTDASNVLGIPLRLNTNINEVSVRASLEASYQQIISDLKTSLPLLPLAPAHVMQPSKTAAYALLARVFLSMQDYTKGALYSDSALQLNNTLLDYNTLNASDAFPVPSFNSEVIFHGIMNVPPHLNTTRAIIDSSLYQSYQNNDLRKTVFFKSNGNGTYAFKGSYFTSLTLFTGIANDEVYLTRAECYAKLNKTNEAMNDLNTLMVNRWKKGTFLPYTATSAADALQQIRKERRKELLLRDTRWMDIKRLNIDGAGISITRYLNNTLSTLPPNDRRFALPIPAYVINLTGMPQN
jgi:hypothetical protein